MKIISLNTWGGRAAKDNFLNFFKKYKDDVDIFCLQEIHNGTEKYFGKLAGGRVLEEIMFEQLKDICSVLVNHDYYFRPHLEEGYGLAMFIRKDIAVKSEGEVYVYKHKGYVPEGELGNHARNIQYINIDANGRPLAVINFHGLWNGQGKNDTEDRINQSNNIIKFINSLNGEVVLCGDFNLLPDTKSIKLFEKSGLRNLIKEYKINSTRSSFYKKPEKYADYIFLSAGVKEKDFKVLQDEVSDHLPLYLEI